jgi:hypothetical protein
LFDVGSVERLLDETVQSLDRQLVPEKFLGDAIITPDCLASLISTLAGALSGPALFATPQRRECPPGNREKFRRIVMDIYLALTLSLGGGDIGVVGNHRNAAVRLLRRT